MCSFPFIRRTIHLFPISPVQPKIRCIARHYISMASNIPAEDLASFRLHLSRSRRIMALLGAGLSASSGLPTFRGAGGLWRDHDATLLATPEAFEADPGLVWQFYGYRRHMALNAKPNAAHYALAELSRKRREFITLSQNVDGLSPRADHPSDQLHLLHGSLFDIKCSGFSCDYMEFNNFLDPIVPALAIPSESPRPNPSTTNVTGNLMDAVRASNAIASHKANIADSSVPLPGVAAPQLPQCPKCKSALLRPGVVWFGEALPRDTLQAVDDFVNSTERIDLIMVIGTSAKVYPAAGYIDEARSRGARVAVINMEAMDKPAGGMRSRDWFFQGDASVIVPELFKEVIGEIDINKVQDHKEPGLRDKDSL